MPNWKPHPGPQELALRTTAYECLYGGARGGGKTEAGIVWLIKILSYARARALVVRRNYEDLKDWIARAREFYLPLGGVCVGHPAEFRFPSGATIVCGHLNDGNAYEKYLGHEYQRMLLEELTQIPHEDNYLKLISSCRSTIDGLEPRIFATTNPGGVGHNWVKERFIDAGPIGKKFETKEGRTRIFIPAKLSDNPTLQKADPNYSAFLNALPDELRRAWRDGDWDVFVGMYFGEWDREIHTYDPRFAPVHKDWKRFRSIDWGYNDPIACYWHAIGPDRTLYTYREYYKSGMLDSLAAREIREITGDERIEYTVGDPSSFAVTVQAKRGEDFVGKRRSEVWSEEGVPITLGDNKRIEGWSLMRQYLQPQEINGELVSRWKISQDCTNLIRELTTAIYDKHNVEDIDPKCSDHGLDSCRYGIMSRPNPFMERRQYRSDIEAAFAQSAREDAARARNLGY